MSKKIFSFFLILFGAFISIFSLIADPLGFGSGPDVVGWKQLTGAVIGIFLAIFGLWLSQLQSITKKDQSK